MAGLPRAQAPIAGNLPPSREWLDYLRGLADAGDVTAIRTALADLGRQVSELAARPIAGAGEVLPIEGQTVVAGKLENGFVKVGLAELEDVGGGELVKIVRDAFGRVAGTEAANLADLEDVSDEPPAEGDVLTFKDGEWLAAAPQSEAFGNLDGGVPGSVYGGTQPIEGGGP